MHDRSTQPILAHLGEAAAAADLVRRFGASAALEAATRAERARGLGNHVHFCRWRQVGRVIGWLAADEASGALH